MGKADNKTTGARAERKQRLAEELRANLKRRKTRMRKARAVQDKRA